MFSFYFLVVENIDRIKRVREDPADSGDVRHKFSESKKIPTVEFC